MQGRQGENPTQASLERTANAVAEVADLRAAVARERARAETYRTQRNALAHELRQLRARIDGVLEAVKGEL